MKKQIMVTTGISDRRKDSVFIENEEGFGSHGYIGEWRKVTTNKKGMFVVVNKKRIYITLPVGEFKLFDEKGNLSTDGCGVWTWVGETVTIDY